MLSMSLAFILVPMDRDKLALRKIFKEIKNAYIEFMGMLSFKATIDPTLISVQLYHERV